MEGGDNNNQHQELNHQEEIEVQIDTSTNQQNVGNHGLELTANHHEQDQLLNGHQDHYDDEDQKEGNAGNDDGDNQDNNHQQQHHKEDLTMEQQQQRDQQQQQQQAGRVQRKNRELSYMKAQNIIHDDLNNQKQYKQGSFNKAQQAKVHNFFAKQKQERALDFKQMRKNLDSLRMPIDIEYLLPNKVRVYEQMRELDEQMNSFIKSKLLSVKEDLLQNNQPKGVKRNLRIMIEVSHVNPTAQMTGSEWKIRIEGRLMGNESEQDQLLTGKPEDDARLCKRFLSFFDRVRVEFPQEEYPHVDWSKAKSDAGANFDCIEIVRAFPKDYKRKQQSIPIKLIFSVENNPKKYRLSPQLTKILGMEEETRLRIIGALWQYIKSNRLQDSDNRELVNCNAELLEIFGDDKVEFHNAIFKLKDHLFEVQPIELNFEIKTTRGTPQVVYHFYDMSVFEYHTESQKEQIEFLINCNYDFFNSNQNPSADQTSGSSTSKLALNGNLLKKRELKQNIKISNSIEKLKKAYRHMDFFNKMSGDVKTQLSNVIIEQNKWLKVIQEEQTPFYDYAGEQDHAVFYQQNQNWIMSEVESYIEQQQIHLEKQKKALADQQSKNDSSHASRADQQDNQNEQSERKSANGAAGSNMGLGAAIKPFSSANIGGSGTSRSGAYSLR
eukprot:403346097